MFIRTEPFLVRMELPSIENFPDKSGLGPGVLERAKAQPSVDKVSSDLLLYAHDNVGVCLGVMLSRDGCDEYYVIMEEWSHSFPRGWIQPFSIIPDSRLMSTDLESCHKLIKEAKEHISKLPGVKNNTVKQ